MIKINFFAGLKRTFPTAVEWQYKENTTVAILIEDLKRQHQEAAELLSRSRAAINEEFVEMTTKLENNMEIFIIPPSSGG